ncbi:PepSY domain-containing protein [Castellaniella caeni]|uniref:PepSY domain-containing protein n=1 Tax=Castellaniella caeni TaxID=266123 RepID=UPI0008359F9D|nr:PepSY domain-containing protein [Castellaniella caeni]
MKQAPHFKPQRAILALILTVVSLPVLASSDCDAPTSQWQSREAVRELAAQQGWQIERLKIDDGCYEIRGTDAQGRRFKAKLDPETLQVLKIKSREHDDHHKDREREHRRDHTSQDADAAPSSPLFTPGGTPRGQVQ